MNDRPEEFICVGCDQRFVGSPILVTGLVYADGGEAPFCDDCFQELVVPWRISQN